MSISSSPYPRLLELPNRSFFLFGPRGVGKSTWLGQVLPRAPRIDLLDASAYLELSQHPDHLAPMAGDLPPGAWVTVDEVQKAPHLLDEVHRLIEERRWRFALCGSSARKLRRGGVNLLGGRAVTRHLDAFVSRELGAEFDLQHSLAWGCLPLVQVDRANARDILSAYVNTYLKEEIKEEGLVRNVPPFLRFLEVAGLLNAQQVNAQNVAREAAVPRSTVDSSFSILSDTLLGDFLPAFRPNVKVREQAHPKFFWFDPGVARAAAGLLYEPADRLWLGSALETLVLHELRVYNETGDRHRRICYYRTAGGAEIDFVIETRKRRQSAPAHVVCIEVKMARQWQRKWESQMRSLAASPRVRVDRMVGVYTGTRLYHFDGVDVWPVAEFLQRLHTGELF